MSLEPRLRAPACVKRTRDLEALDAGFRKLKSDDRLILYNEDDLPVWTCGVQRVQGLHGGAPTDTAEPAAYSPEQVMKSNW